VRKDTLVIERAAALLAANEAPGAEVARELLEASKRVDREFLRRVAHLPVRIAVPYERVAPLRLRRIGLLLEGSHRVLANWREGRRLREAFPAGELESRLLDVLQLYAEETQALSHSVRLPALFAGARDRLARALARAMSDAAGPLAHEAARLIASHKSS